ncbi:ketoreductase [Schizosaccharomyces japonicus yFS275]|uniref:Very-long-chain 3-oxoacyl-CoA reductase n=1 Tax=Schizosaccharomyces japonicus (strain yFS275 / FY16936) TaxID=402676 RepID=B6JW60_SCHJY|nr:ketoreductase [Schizosaccharomyces japonicus yFS275]EEB05611.1 ketoreductase [Schizosaccharomyces japonicus yFS275]
MISALFPSCTLLKRLLLLVGVTSTLMFLGSLARCIYNCTAAKGKSLTVYGAKKNAWAVVTGATDGIGKEYALQLAKAGFNIVIVSRNPEKLSRVAQEITEAYRVEVQTYVIDYKIATAATFQKLAEFLKPFQVTVLVNNVGLSHNMPVSFSETTEQEMDDIMQINCFGTLHTTKAVLPSMLEQRRSNKNGPRCLILTMGSFAGLLPSPYLSTYAGSKAFLANWSASLAEEVKKEGIDVWCYQSYLVCSAMSKVRRPTATIPTPKNFVREALGSIGVQRGGNQPYISQPFPSHAALSWVLEQAASRVKGFVVAQVAAMHLSIRSRALRKQAREQQKAKETAASA